MIFLWLAFPMCKLIVVLCHCILPTNSLLYFFVLDLFYDLSLRFLRTWLCFCWSLLLLFFCYLLLEHNTSKIEGSTSTASKCCLAITLSWCRITLWYSKWICTTSKEVCLILVIPWSWLAAWIAKTTTEEVCRVILSWVHSLLLWWLWIRWWVPERIFTAK